MGKTFKYNKYDDFNEDSELWDEDEGVTRYNRKKAKKEFKKKNISKKRQTRPDKQVNED